MLAFPFRRVRGRGESSQRGSVAAVDLDGVVHGSELCHQPGIQVRVEPGGQGGSQPRQHHGVRRVGFPASGRMLARGPLDLTELQGAKAQQLSSVCQCFYIHSGTSQSVGVAFRCSYAARPGHRASR